MFITTTFFGPPRRFTFRWFRPILFRAPIPARIVLKRFVSTRHATNSVHERRIDGEVIDSLLLSIDKFAINGRRDALVERYVHKKLSSEKLMSPSRHVAFEEVISLLMARRYIPEAGTVYQRMLDEGLIPSSSTNAKMIAVTLALSADPDDQLISALDDVFVDPTYTDSHLRELLDLIADLDPSSRASLIIAERFVNSRGSRYTPSNKLLTKLVGIQTRAGLMDDALDSLVRSEFGDDTKTQSTTDSHPYAAILRSIKDTQPQNTQAINTVLSHMEKHGVRADISIFNALIGREVHQRSLHNAFALYEVITHLSETTPLAPDASTFGSLFSILTKLYRPTARTARSRHYKCPDNIIPPRHLYRDMIARHLTCPSPGIITPSILNVALRTFLSKHDYVGAFVVVRAFSTFHLRPTAKTYYIAMRHLMNRIRWDPRRTGEPRWVDRLLGLPNRPHANTSVRDLKIDETLVEKILRFGHRAGFDVVDGPDPNPAHRRYVTPTLAMMYGDEPVPSTMSLDSVPLERILRRAILADLHRNNSVLRPPGGGDPPAKLVSRAIAEGKEEMLPRDT